MPLRRDPDDNNPEHLRYAAFQHFVAAVKYELKMRSPVRHLAKAADVPLDINTGIHDGHTGSVPVSQSIEAFK